MSPNVSMRNKVFPYLHGYFWKSTLWELQNLLAMFERLFFITILRFCTFLGVIKRNFWRRAETGILKRQNDVETIKRRKCFSNISGECDSKHRLTKCSWGTGAILTTAGITGKTVQRVQILFVLHLLTNASVFVGNKSLLKLGLWVNPTSKQSKQTCNFLDEILMDVFYYYSTGYFVL